MIEWIALLSTGAAAGLLAGLLGIGGGLVIVPAVTALLVARGLSVDAAVPAAVATALGSMLLTSASSALAHARGGRMDWAAALRLGPALALGGLFGGWIAPALGGAVLARVFGALAAVIGLRMLFAVRPARAHRPAKARGWWAAGPLIGALSALIGIGGGSFNVPYLVHNGYSPLRAVAVAAACGWPIALAGATGFALRGLEPGAVPGLFGHLYLPGMVLVGLAGLASAPLGARLAERLGSERLGRVFGALLLVVALRMALQ
ncbi:sulfite exporter TauE/SafE family protein [Halomonas denitrificans]|nr:sulfite exporter TauE/SafE family protein [Halomonas denitrificans]